MRGSAFAVAILAVAGVGLAFPAAADAAAAFASGLEVPVSLAFDAEGRLYFAELETGIVRILHADGSASEPWATLPSSPGGNGGLLGIAADPDRVGVLYAYYTLEKPDAKNGKVNRVVRLEAVDAAGAVEETVLLDDIPFATLHDGGRVAVGADGYLYATMGDAEDKAGAGDPMSLVGKVLRMTRDGEPAPGNPEGWHPYAFAKGFRNPFGLAALPDGRIYVSDNGGKEEVNLLEKGGDFGWPHCSGPCDRSDTVDPVAHWDTNFGPTGIDVFDDVLYLGDYVYGHVRTVDLLTGETGIFWQSPTNAVLDVAVGPDRCLYASDRGNVWRMPLTQEPCGLPDVGLPEVGAHDDAGGSNAGEEDESTGDGRRADLPDNETPGLRGPLMLVAAAAVAITLRKRSHRGS